MVAIRLDQLGIASRSAELEGELLAERASLLDLSGPQPSEPPKAQAAVAVGSLQINAQEQMVRKREVCYL